MTVTISNAKYANISIYIDSTKPGAKPSTDTGWTSTGGVFAICKNFTAPWSRTQGIEYGIGSSEPQAIIPGNIKYEWSCDNLFTLEAVCNSKNLMQLSEPDTIFAMRVEMYADPSDTVSLGTLVLEYCHIEKGDFTIGDEGAINTPMSGVALTRTYTPPSTT